MGSLALAVYLRCWLLVGLASGYVAFTLYTHGLNWLEIPNGPFVAAVAVLSNMLNELGHWLVIRLTGIRAYIRFFPLFAIIVPLDKERFEQRTHREEALFALAGPTVNFILMGIGVSLYWWTPYAVEGGIIAQINAGITVLNMIPFLPFFDGSRVLRVVYQNSDPRKDRVIAGILTAAIIASYVPLLLRGRLHPYPLMAIGGTHWHRRKTSADAHLREDVLPEKEVNLLSAWLVVKLVTAMVVMLSIKPAITIQLGEIATKFSFIWRSVS